MASESGQRHEPHRAAIELNNVAISLLDKGFFIDSVATMEDAIALMGSSLNAEASHLSNGAMHLALERAHKRSALLKSGAVVLPNAGLAKPGATNNLQVISTQNHPTRVYDALTAPRDRGAAINVAFPMRIEPVDFEHCTGHDATFEFSVMLYNYGIVLECVAPYVDVGIHDCFARSSFQRKAYQVYLCARSLLHEVDQGVVQNAPIDLAGQVLLVRTAVSHNLLSSSIDLDLRLDYSEHCHTMMVLLTLVGSQQEFLPISDANMAPAA